MYDYKKHFILYVDDEEMSLKYFTRVFGDQFRVLTATNATDGLKLLEEHKGDVSLLMTDQRMPGKNGVWLLEQCRLLDPSIIRVLSTAYSDMEAAISAVNTGAIYKFITKPWEISELESTIKRGVEFFLVEKERDKLLHEKMSVLHDMMSVDRVTSLGLMTAGMSHHIRNALVSVKTFLDLLPTKLESDGGSEISKADPDYWTGYHTKVVNEVSKINGLLADLWEASEKSPAQFVDRVSIRTVLESTVSTLRERITEKNISIHLDVPADLAELTVDGARFHRLFELLLADELASLPNGSSIRFAATEQSDRVHGRQIHLELIDDGPSLPQEQLRYIFDPFVARSDSPMEFGVHLMACYFIVHQHGGRIAARANPERGTTFTLRLPCNPAAAAAGVKDTEKFQRQQLEDALWEKTFN